jgi:hypothetical protein
LLGKPIVYVENYLASEGFLGFRAKGTSGINLILNNNIYFEFVPFDDKNFDSEGVMIEQPEAKMVHEVEKGKEYALLMSTNSGVWRYLLGDTVKFTNPEKGEILITGRTKSFLSLVGEHLSVENMNRAISLVSEELNISIPEYTVVGFPYENMFAHKWYIVTNDSVDPEKLKKRIDENLRVLNDDYATERDSALKEVFLEILTEQRFMQFMEQKGKLGDQHKFPRVMKGKMLKEWEQFLLTGTIEV